MKRFCALLLLVAPAVFAADRPAIPRAGETIEVSIVNLDVIVTDKRGHRVHGLTKDDFEVFEDGKPQAITNFAAYSPEPSSTITESKAGASGPAEAPKRQRRTIAIFVESFRLPGFRVKAIFDSLKKTLHEVVAPGDAVLIATWNVRTIVRLDYTDDLAAIDKALDTVANESTGAAFNALDMHLRQIEELKEWFSEAAAEAAAAGMTADSAGDQWSIDMEAEASAMNEMNRIRAKAAAINSFISTMANDEGRKALILMTRRFSQIAGGEYFYAINPGDPLDTEQRGHFQTYNLLEAIKATANAHNVTIYTMYPPGLEATNFSSPTMRSMPSQRAAIVDHQVLDNELATLSDLAKSTGGTLAWGSVDISQSLPRLRDDFEDYYSLAYRVAPRNDNRARNVVVKTKNPNYVVRTRKQYMEKNDDGRVRDQLIAALFRTPNPSGITVSASLGKPVPQQKKRFVIPVSVRVPVNSFMTTQEGASTKGAFSVYIATGRVVGETSDITKQTIPFTVADVQKAKDGYFTYDFSLLTDFATNRLAIGVYDEVSHDSGFARVNLY